MRGWQNLKHYFERLWKHTQEILNKREAETSQESPLRRNGTRTEADWEATKRRAEQARFQEKEREEARRRLEEQIAEEEEQRQERRRWQEAPTLSDAEGLRPQPPKSDYAGARPTQQIRWDSSWWITSGEFRLVENSDNVYAIAYDVHTGSLFVQYKHWAPPMPLGSQHGPGPIYEYKGVSIAEAHALYRAKDVGSWLWDNVRVRGTWGDHQKPYRLVATSYGYLPRKATRWTDGREWFIRRQIWNAHGKAQYSDLPNRPAPPMGFDGQPDWSARPLRNLPYNGRPDNGRPNTGRPRRQ